MNLRINHVKRGNGSNPNEEFVFLEVLQDTNLHHYVIGDNSYNQSGQISNKHPHTFRFPDKKVKKGEFVSLWSGIGNPDYELVETNKGQPLHRFYWGLKTCVWNNTGDVAHLLQVMDTKNTPAK